MAAAYVRALATVLLMGRVAVLDRYRAVPVALLCAQGRRPASPAAFCTRGRRPASPAALCTRGRRPARSPSAPRAFGSARRLEARPGPAAALGHYSLPHAEGAPHHPPRPRRHPRIPQPPAHCTAATNTPRPCRRPRAPQPPAHCTVTTNTPTPRRPPSDTADPESGSHNKHPRARGPGVLICDRGAKTTCPRRSPYG